MLIYKLKKREDEGDIFVFKSWKKSKNQKTLLKNLKFIAYYYSSKYFQIDNPFSMH